MAGGLSPPIVGLRRLREPSDGLWTKGRLRPQDADGDAASTAAGAGDTNNCSVRSGLYLVRSISNRRSRRCP